MTANTYDPLGDISRVVLASLDNDLLAQLKTVLEPLDIEVLSLVDVGLPEPPVSDDDLHSRAATTATVVAMMTELPAIGFGRGFYIHPMLRWGFGGVQWHCPFPWPGSPEALVATLRQIDDELNAGGYCDHEDRGAYFRSTISLAGWSRPDL